MRHHHRIQLSDGCLGMECLSGSDHRQYHHLKPSLKTPLCAITIQKMCQDAIQEAGFPNVISLLTASDALCEQLVNHKDVDIISFTGSCSVGQKVGTMVQSRFGQCILELGGNNAIIVDEDANLDLAIPAIVFGAGTSGQRCTTTRRVFLPKTQFESISKTDSSVSTNTSGPAR